MDGAEECLELTRDSVYSGSAFCFCFFFFPREISEDSEYINSTSGGLDWACHVSAT